MSFTRESVSSSIRRRSPVSRLTNSPVAGELSNSMARPMNVAHLQHVHDTRVKRGMSRLFMLNDLEGLVRIKQKKTSCQGECRCFLQS